MWFIPVAIVVGLVGWALASKPAGVEDAVRAYRATLTDIALTGQMSATRIAAVSKELHKVGELQRADNLDTLLAQGAGTGINTPLMTRVAAAAGTHDGTVMLALAELLARDKPTGWAPIVQQLQKLAAVAQTNPQKVAA